MTWFTLRRESIDAFKRSWPAHGLPDDLESISAEIDCFENLIDLEAYDENEKQIDTAAFDGPALVALVADCIGKGDVTRSARFASNDL